MKKLIRLNDKIASDDQSFKELVVFIKTLVVANDVKKTIKNVLDGVIAKELQSQLSWTGIRTMKPSLKKIFKYIVQAIHYVLRDSFKDYGFEMLEIKVMALLQGAKFTFKRNFFCYKAEVY